MSTLLTLSSLSGALAVGLGAFGAHALRGNVSDKMMDTWDTASHYHLIHSTALLAIGVFQQTQINASSGITSAGNLMFTGMTLFSGSLYIMVVTDIRGKFGIITPIGGLFLIAGWLKLAYEVQQQK